MELNKYLNIVVADNIVASLSYKIAYASYLFGQLLVALPIKYIFDNLARLMSKRYLTNFNKTSISLSWIPGFILKCVLIFPVKQKLVSE